MTLRFLGDVHGCWSVVDKMLKRHKDSTIIQVGDLGLGFPRVYKKLNLNTGEYQWKEAKPDPVSFDPRFKFIRGNHDNPQVCATYPNYMGDFGIDPETGVFFISGGMSTDRNDRTIGQDWWEDEELSYQQLGECMALYEQTKPDVVVSHECPDRIVRLLHSHHGSSRTSSALEQMMTIHSPRAWVFGHHHKMWVKEVDHTQFACCAINQAISVRA